MKQVDTVGMNRREPTQQEREEILDTESMIWSNFVSGLGSPEVQAAADSLAPAVRPASGPRMSQMIREAADKAKSQDGDAPSDHEQAMMTLMEIRDEFISLFQDVSGDPKTYDLFVKSIHRIEKCLKKLGTEDFERFNPLAHLSGLEGNEILKNADDVVENTKKHYRLHKLAAIQAEMERDMPCISVEIEGTDGGVPFRVVGRIYAPEDFSGNEAIDFVNNSGRGLLTVKAISLGRWQDVSDRFDIRWDIEAVDSKNPDKDAE